eukprot:scaffold123921_cov66-Phaeocystis_antarctica.AAC.9
MVALVLVGRHAPRPGAAGRTSLCPSWTSTTCVLNAAESATSAATHGRTAAYHWALSGSAARPEGLVQPGPDTRRFQRAARLCPSRSSASHGRQLGVATGRAVASATVSVAVAVVALCAAVGAFAAAATAAAATAASWGGGAPEAGAEAGAEAAAAAAAARAAQHRQPGCMGLWGIGLQPSSANLGDRFSLSIVGAGTGALAAAAASVGALRSRPRALATSTRAACEGEADGAASVWGLPPRWVGFSVAVAASSCSSESTPAWALPPLGTPPPCAAESTERRAAAPSCSSSTPGIILKAPAGGFQPPDDGGSGGGGSG